MGARPVATLLSIALPPDAADAWAAEFIEGYRELSATFGTALAGGDTTRSESGITINVTAIGRAPSANLKRRSDARPGDVIFAAGELGASGAGLRDILAGRCDTPQAAVHRNPQPQVAEGLWFGTRPEVHAMMDLSDGLASDLRHILDRSGVGAEVEVERIPVAPAPMSARQPARAKTTNCCSPRLPTPPNDLPRSSRPASAAPFTPSAASPPHRASCGSATENPSRWTGTGSNTIKKERQPAGCLCHSRMIYTCSSRRCMW